MLIVWAKTGSYFIANVLCREKRCFPWAWQNPMVFKRQKER